jgi:Uma2 family endonuclease
MTTPAYTVSEEEMAIWREIGFERPPTQYELECSDDRPMDDEPQALQMDMLFEPLRFYYEGQKVHVGKNQIIYYSADQVRRRDFLGPDVYVVLDVEPGSRASWVIWEEGKGPDVVIEILSWSTRRRDKGEKKQIYQDNIRVKDYVWYDPHTQELEGFTNTDKGFVTIPKDDTDRLPCPALDLLLMVWDGVYQGRPGKWLRWATASGELLPLREEAERQRADAERQRADAERQRADAIARQVAERDALLRRYRERFGDLET